MLKQKKMIEFVSKHMLERINYYNMAKFHVAYDLNDKNGCMQKNYWNTKQERPLVFCP